MDVTLSVALPGDWKPGWPLFARLPWGGTTLVWPSPGMRVGETMFFSARHPGVGCGVPSWISNLDVLANAASKCRKLKGPPKPPRKGKAQCAASLGGVRGARARGVRARVK